MRWFWVAGVALILTLLSWLARLILLGFGQKERVFGFHVDVFVLPVLAATLAGLTTAFQSVEETGSAKTRTLSELHLFLALGVISGGYAVLGLFFVSDVGAALLMPLILVLGLGLGLGGRLSRRFQGVSAGFLGILLLALLIVPGKYTRELISFASNGSAGYAQGPGLTFPDTHLVRMDRNAYRLLASANFEETRKIPSLLAHEVVLEAARIRYQALDGAGRDPKDGKRSDPTPWAGAGYLMARAPFADETFLAAATTDYVYLMYARAEFGAVFLLALLMLYILFLFVLRSRDGSGSLNDLSIWAPAVGVGNALLMLGGTSGVFPFTGKWPFGLAFSSGADLVLVLVLGMLALAGSRK